MRGRGKKAKTPRNIPSAQLCWRCQNAVPNKTGRGCNWSRKGEPVEGWTATATDTERNKNERQCYKITACPEFVPDRKRILPKVPPNRKTPSAEKPKPEHGKYFEWYCKKNGVTAEQYAANIDKLPADVRALLNEICEKGTTQKQYAKAHYCTTLTIVHEIQKAFSLLREYAQVKEYFNSGIRQENT